MKEKKYTKCNYCLHVNYIRPLILGDSFAVV